MKYTGGLCRKSVKYEEISHWCKEGSAYCIHVLYVLAKELQATCSNVICFSRDLWKRSTFWHDNKMSPDCVNHTCFPALQRCMTHLKVKRSKICLFVFQLFFFTNNSRQQIYTMFLPPAIFPSTIL